MKKSVAISIISILAVIAIGLGALAYVNNADKTKQIDDLSFEVADQATQIDNLNADVADKAGQIETLNADVADKAGQIESLNVEVADKAGQIEKLNADVADKAGQIENLNTDVADKAGQIETLNADVADKAGQIETLNADVANKVGQIATLTADVANRDEQISSLTADVADKAGQIESLNADAADKATRIEMLTADIADKDNKITALNTDIAQKQAEINALTAENEAQGAEISSLMSQAAEADALIQDQSSQIEELSQQITAKDEEITGLTTALAEKDAEIAELSKKAPAANTEHKSGVVSALHQKHVENQTDTLPEEVVTPYVPVLSGDGWEITSEYKYDGYSYYYSFAVKHSKPGLQRIEANVTFFDEAGDIIGAKSADVFCAEAGHEYYLEVFNDAPFDHTEVQFKFSDAAYMKSHASMLDVSSNVINNKVLVTGVFNGETSVELTAEVNALFLKDGEVVYTDCAYLKAFEDVNPEETMMTEISSYEDFDDVKIFYDAYSYDW